MKLSKWNTLLLFCNVLLLLVAAYFGFFARPERKESPESADQQVDSRAGTRREASTEVVTVTTNEFRWRQLESENYRTYIERLRSIGCPEQTIRDIIIADLDKLTAARIEALQGRRADLQFWHSEEEELANDRDAREIARKQREIDQEKRAVIEELLGIDLVRERLRLKGEQDYYERRLGFLPEERRKELRKVLERYDELEQHIWEKDWDEGDALGVQDHAELRRLRNQRQAEVAALLTPAEREQYELWMSETANAVRYGTYGMDISKEEFLAIYNLRKQFDEEWAGRDPALMDESTRQNWQGAWQHMQNELEHQLGPQRFAEYVRGQDNEFHQLSATVTRFKLPSGTAQKVYEVKRALDDVRETVANSTLTTEQRRAALKAMQEESERTVRQLLGQKAYSYYVRRGDASWLRSTE
ncbi:MAG: hypothetical protein L0Y58_07920 [Verrucomicrobia subdivision 3 bacterium]|nr:hypothetical protein [Limisphaerales bacterium]